MSTLMSRCSSPIPRRMVWPDSWSVETRKVGSSAASFCRATPSFSWSALDFGSMAISITGSGVLQPGQGDDVAGVGFLDVLAVVGVHEQHPAHPLAPVARGIEQAHAA